MKYNFDIKEIDKYTAYKFISTYHYSNTMPRLTKHYLGIFDQDNMVGCLTLGWGTQPRQTINKLIPGLDTQYYYEIGRMCMTEEMPRNSESQMLSAVVKWMKENTGCLYLYTWADGIMSKPGYVYQSANFLYGGYIWTDIYCSKEGEKIHPRSAKELLQENAQYKGVDKLCWLTYDFMKEKGINRYKGKQFRYIYPLNKFARKLLHKKSPFEWNTNYPKSSDIVFKVQTDDGYKICEPPPFNMDLIDVNRKNVESYLKS